MALTFAQYVLQPFYSVCHLPDDAVRLLAAATICESLIVNLYIYITSNTYFYQVSCAITTLQLKLSVDRFPNIC